MMMLSHKVKSVSKKNGIKVKFNLASTVYKGRGIVGMQ